VKYDGLNNIDLLSSRRLTIETGRHAPPAEILMAANDRLYITQARDARFRAAALVLPSHRCKILDAQGHASAAHRAGNPKANPPIHRRGGIVMSLTRSRPCVGIMARRWRCLHTAYFKSAAHQPKRYEDARIGTITNSGLRFRGDLILVGSRWDIRRFLGCHDRDHYFDTA